MSCGFGAVVLVFLIIDHSLEVEIRTVNAEVLSELELLEEDIREGEAGLVRLRNALDDADLDIVEADGLAQRITEELDEYEALIASIEESGVSDSDAIAKLQAEINQLEEEIRLLEEASEAEAGRSAREFVGEGNRQYLTGLNLGGRRIAIMVDTSASMLANQLVNVIRLRNMDPELQKQAGKWTRTLDTVDWLTAQLPVNAQFQVMTFNTEAKPALEGTEAQWLEVADTPKLEAISLALAEQVPAGGTSLHNAFGALAALLLELLHEEGGELVLVLLDDRLAEHRQLVLRPVVQFHVDWVVCVRAGLFVHERVLSADVGEVVHARQQRLDAARVDQPVGLVRLGVVGEVRGDQPLELHPEVAVVELDHVTRGSRAGDDGAPAAHGEHRGAHRGSTGVLEDDVGVLAGQFADVVGMQNHPDRQAALQRFDQLAGHAARQGDRHARVNTQVVQMRYFGETL